MLVYKCRDLTNSSAATTSAPCHSVHEEANACRGNLLVAGWAIGAGVRQYFYMYMYICVWMIHTYICTFHVIICTSVFILVLLIIHASSHHLDICVS